MKTITIEIPTSFEMPIDDGCVVLDGQTPIAVTRRELDAYTLVEALKAKWKNLSWSYKRLNGQPNSKEEEL